MRYKCPYRQKQLAKIINQILDDYGKPLRLRQLWYELLQNHNYVPEQYWSKDRHGNLYIKDGIYRGLSDKLGTMRKRKLVSWEKIIDEERGLSAYTRFTNVDEFMGSVSSWYHRDLLQTQPQYIEVWSEKYLSISDIAEKYGVGLMMGGGFQSLSNLYDTAKRFTQIRKPILILYLGDFDPSGMCVEDSILKELKGYWRLDVTIRRVLVNFEDTKGRPSIPAKGSDSRYKGYVKKYGTTRAWELQAMSPKETDARLEQAIRESLDMSAFEAEKKQQTKDSQVVNKYFVDWR